MNEIIKKAIEKVDGEAEKIGTIPAHRICEHIISKITNESNAEKVIKDNKTLADCISNITKKAKEQAKSGMAMIEDDEVYSWVDEYFGFENDSSSEKIIDLFDVL